jgi:hypothetical protein
LIKNKYTVYECEDNWTAADTKLAMKKKILYPNNQDLMDKLRSIPMSKLTLKDIILYEHLIEEMKKEQEKI